MGAAVPEKVRRHTGGRPSQADALRRDERLVEIAAAMFMDRGFDATTIDAVAEAASVGKATLYARYKDKGELFAAVLKRQVDRWITLNLPTPPAPGERAAEVLLRLACRVVASSIAPEGIAIKRIVIAQATRFPELAQMVHREGWQRATAAVATVLRTFAEDGQIAVDDPDLAADLFLSLVIGRQAQLATLGIAADPEQIDRRVQAAVALFMRGVKP